MKTSSMENLLKLVKKHNLNINLSLEALLDQLVAVSSEHAHLVNSINEAVNGSKYIKAVTPDGFLTECPNCGSHTLLNFTECHLCGEALVEFSEASEPAPAKDIKADKKKNEVKEEPKKKKAPVAEVEEDEFEEVESPYKKKNAKETVIAPDEDEDDDLDLSLDDDEEEKPAPKADKKKATKEEPKKKAAPVKDDEDDLDFGDDEEEVKPAKGKKEAPKADKKKAPVKEEPEEDELDLDFDDEEEEPAPKAAKKKAPVKEEPKKAAKADKKAPQPTEEDDELGELNEDFDLSDFEEETDDDADAEFDEE